jgi:prepilin-type N-terminal cleavage/methylation domain-containing protein
MKKNGFTLIELLVSIGIIAILASVGFVNLYGYFQRKNLDLLGQEITAVLRNAQNNSISQEQSEQWGVHFENTTSTDDADFYVLFYGASYAVSTSSQKSVLSSGTGFTNPPAGMSFDVIFAPATGITTSTVISIVGTSAGTVKDIVIKNTGGVVDNLEEGLVGYWHFDEGTGHATTTDASGYENTGTLTNSPTWTSGASCKSGGCISFDGSNNYVNAGNGASLNIINAITINSWFKINSQPSSGSWFVMIDKGVSNSPPKGYIVQYYNDGVNYRLESGYVSSGGYKIPSIIKQLNIGEWYNIIWVHDTTNDRDYFYLNGINQSFSYRVGSYVDVIDLSSAINLTIGISSIITKPFNGLIDDVRVYNRALSATEVLKLYNDFK